MQQREIYKVLTEASQVYTYDQACVYHQVRCQPSSLRPPSSLSQPSSIQTTTILYMLFLPNDINDSDSVCKLDIVQLNPYLIINVALMFKL